MNNVKFCLESISASMKKVCLFAISAGLLLSGEAFANPLANNPAHSAESTPSLNENVPFIVVTGKITNDKGEPVAGASITVKNGSTGVSTESDGSFSINVPGDATLVISAVGFTTQEIAVGNRTTINVTLLNTASALDEIVVVGFGTQKKVNLTGAVSSVNAKALEARPVTNTQQALQGLILCFIIITVFYGG